MMIPKKTKKAEETIIVADIGGTKTDVAFCAKKKHKNDFTVLFVHTYASKKITSLTELINKTLAFVKQKYSVHCTNACLAVAGYVENEKAHVTNLDLVVDVRRIKKETSLKHVLLLNDFEALGFGVTLLKKNDLLQLGSQKIQKNKAKAILGAGTGLGMGILFFDKKTKRYVPAPSEGGHVSFAPANMLQKELSTFIAKKYGLIPEYEHLVSGQGLLDVYAFLLSKNIVHNKKREQKIALAKNKQKLIEKYALIDPLCRETIRLFISCYAQAAKQLALLTLPKGGMYITGGIAPKIISFFQEYAFRKIFEEHARMHSLLKQIPLFVVKNPYVSLLGCCIGFFDTETYVLR